MRKGTLLIAVLLLAAGIYGGQTQEVLHKAIFICLECIGLG
jgi:hypothetical protein